MGYITTRKLYLFTFTISLILLLATALIWPTVGFTALGEQKNTGENQLTSAVSGEAFGLDIGLTAILGLTKINVGPLPHVTLPSKGGFESDVLLQVEVPGIITSDTLPVVTAGAIGPKGAGTTSIAAAEHVDILDGLIKADLVLALCSSIGDGATAVSETAGSVIANLWIGGKKITATPKPNTRITLVEGPLNLKVGEVILNEQIFGGDSTQNSEVTVNMIRVILAEKMALGELLKGDIVVSSAHCGVDAEISEPEEPPFDKGFMTGGGRLGDNPDNIATFGFNARQNEGQLQYIDHTKGFKVHGTVDSLTILDENCATFSGSARVNNEEGFSFEVEACDNSEPGIGRDTFFITVTGSGVDDYQRGGILTGGNIQMH